jgi:Uma2 family endonuclease
MDTAVRQITADDLFKMPSDDFFYELVKGELRKMPPGGGLHGAIAMSFGAAIVVHVQENDLGIVTGPDTGFILQTDPDTVRAPDIAFVSTENIPPSGIPEKYWPGPPDLAVEVVSPNDTLYEIEEKIADYLSTGVRMIVYIHPRKRTVTVYRPGSPEKVLTEKDTFDGEDVLPGFRYPAARLFSLAPKKAG